jgi:exodeoxyribonuclease VII large subunit
MSAAARAFVKHRSEELRHLERDVGAASAELVHRRRGALQDVAGRLNALSPVATLARGYAVARSEDGVTLSELAAFRDGMPFELVVRDGVVSAEVRGRRANKSESA